MKHKIIIFSLLLVFAVFPVTPKVEAQTFSIEQQATLDQLNQTLISLLTQLIAQLQAQITELIAQQADQATQLGSVTQKGNTVQSPPNYFITPYSPNPTH